MKPQKPPRPYSEIQTVRLVWLAIFVSVFSFLFYQRHGDVLLYGDAVAHINIARRVFDSKTPGLLQLGTVWLPLPHLLILPFIVSTKMWQSGAGGSIPSMAAYVLGVLGIFRLVRTALTRDGEVDGAARVAAWAAAIFYGANPNLSYMQATAMGEALYLALFIWAVVYFAEFVRSEAKAFRSLTRCGLCLATACLTRYDGWFLAAVLAIGAVVVTFRARKADDEKAAGSAVKRSPVTPSQMMLLKFVLVAAVAPVFWLAYNAVVYRNPLEFANGPYSAKAIEQKTATVNPAKGNLWAAGSYFVKAAELNVSEANWQARLWLVLALLGSLQAAFSGRARALLLLWAPLPFYAVSIAYGSVPIFVPIWWPFSYYNLRYGLQLLPTFAVFVPMGIAVIVESAARIPRVDVAWRRWSGAATLLGAIVLGAVNYGAIWRADPICHREAVVNSRGRVALDTQVASWIKRLPADSMLLMYLGEHVGALEQIGIPLWRVINEGNHRVWIQPADPEGLWERALADPGKYADYAIGFDADPVWRAATGQHLLALVEIHTTGQPRATIFQTRTPGQ
ncbi:MAG: hypothetical protein WB660_28650 [Candidatus Sulfotelmatobacter sp.]